MWSFQINMIYKIHQLILILNLSILQVFSFGKGPFEGWQGSHLEFKKSSDGNVQYKFQPCPQSQCTPQSPQFVTEVNVNFSKDTVLCGYGLFVLHETSDLSSNPSETDAHIFYTLTYNCVTASYLSKVRSIEYLLPLPNTDNYFLSHMISYGHTYAIFKERNFGGEHAIGEWDGIFTNAQTASFVLLGHKTVKHKLKIYKEDGSTEEVYRCFMVPPGSDNSTLCLMEDYGDKVPELLAEGVNRIDLVDYTFFEKYQIEKGMTIRALENGCENENENVHIPVSSCHQPGGLVELPKRKVETRKVLKAGMMDSPLITIKKDQGPFLQNWPASKLEFRTALGEIQYVFQACLDLKCAGPTDLQQHVKQINITFTDRTIICGLGPFVLYENENLKSKDDGMDTHIFYSVKYTCAKADYIQRIKSIEFIIPTNKAMHWNGMKSDYSTFKEKKFAGNLYIFISFIRDM